MLGVLLGAGATEIKGPLLEFVGGHTLTKDPGRSDITTHCDKYYDKEKYRTVVKYTKKAFELKEA